MNTANGLIPRGLIRQGDVLLIPVDADVAGEAGQAPAVRHKVARVGGKLVLAEGEATGHAHVVAEAHARLEKQEYGTRRAVWINRRAWSDSRIVLVVEDRPAQLRHEEHDPLIIPEGAYEVRRQREFRPTGVGLPGGWSRVAD